MKMEAFPLMQTFTKSTRSFKIGYSLLKTKRFSGFMQLRLTLQFWVGALRRHWLKITV